MAAPKVSLKLLIDTKGRKVLFAEAGKDFVDFLFHLLSLPIGTVIRLITTHSMLCCLGNLYESIQNLNQIYMQPNLNKDSLLNPKSPICAADVPLLLPADVSATKTMYVCGSHHRYVADDPRAICPRCNHNISTEVTYVTQARAEEEEGGDGGFVKGVVTYMVMDDLVVQPMSTISSIALLNKFNVKEVGDLEEKVVDLEMAEGLKLLKASLQSKKVLTSIFLGNMGA